MSKVVTANQQSSFVQRVLNRPVEMRTRSDGGGGGSIYLDMGDGTSFDEGEDALHRDDSIFLSLEGGTIINSSDKLALGALQRGSADNVTAAAAEAAPHHRVEGKRTPDRTAKPKSECWMDTDHFIWGNSVH